MPKRTHKGMSLLEVVIGVSVLTLVIVGVVASYQFLIRYSGTTSNLVKAQFLLEESLEVSRILRDTDWTTFANKTTGIPYYLALSGSVWEATTTPVVIDGLFYRTIQFAPVYRDGQDDVAPSGTLENDARFVTASVSWREENGTTTRTVSGFFTNIFE